MTPLGSRVSPALDRAGRCAEAAEPSKETHPGHVENCDPDPTPHGTNGTPMSARRHREIRGSPPVCGNVTRATTLRLPATWSRLQFPIHGHDAFGTVELGRLGAATWRSLGWTSHGPSGLGRLTGRESFVHLPAGKAELWKGVITQGGKKTMQWGYVLRPVGRARPSRATPGNALPPTMHPRHGPRTRLDPPSRRLHRCASRRHQRWRRRTAGSPECSGPCRRTVPASHSRPGGAAEPNRPVAQSR